jgi:hypothetical protein
MSSEWTCISPCWEDLAMAWVTNVMQMWCKCGANVLFWWWKTLLQVHCLSCITKCNTTQESDYSLWFSVGSMCSFEFFFSNSMYFGPQGWCLEVGEHCALSLLQIVKFGCFEEVASYIHLFVGKLQKFWINTNYVCATRCLGYGAACATFHFIFIFTIEK